MNRTLGAAALISLIVGVVVGYAFSYGEILRLQSEIERLKLEISMLQTAFEQLVKCFLVGDSCFTAAFDENDWWGVEDWHGNPDSISEIEDGTLHLFYNETEGDWYGNSGAYQGRHPDGRNTTRLWVSGTPEAPDFRDYVVFPKSMLSYKFQLETRFRILDVGFNCYPSVFDPTHGRVNLGITLMCAINDRPYSVEAQTLWLDIYFAGYGVNENHTWFIPKDANYVDIHDDVHAGYFVGEVPPSDFGKWVTMSIDLGDYIGKTLNLITEVDIETIRVYGFIVFVECLGAYAEVEYNYIETNRFSAFSD